METSPGGLVCVGGVSDGSSKKFGHQAEWNKTITFKLGHWKLGSVRVGVAWEGGMKFSWSVGSSFQLGKETKVFEQFYGKSLADVAKKVSNPVLSKTMEGLKKAGLDPSQLKLKEVVLEPIKIGFGAGGNVKEWTVGISGEAQLGMVVLTPKGKMEMRLRAGVGVTREKGAKKSKMGAGVWEITWESKDMKNLVGGLDNVPQELGEGVVERGREGEGGIVEVVKAEVRGGGELEFEGGGGKEGERENENFGCGGVGVGKGKEEDKEMEREGGYGEENMEVLDCSEEDARVIEDEEEVVVQDDGEGVWVEDDDEVFILEGWAIDENDLFMDGVNEGMPNVENVPQVFEV